QLEGLHRLAIQSRRVSQFRRALAELAGEAAGGSTGLPPLQTCCVTAAPGRGSMAPSRRPPPNPPGGTPVFHPLPLSAPPTLLSPGPGAGAKAKADAAWQAVPVLTDGELAVSLEVRKQASLGDAVWLALEFRNPGKTPRRVRNAYYRIEAQRDDLQTGQRRSSG